MNSFESNELNRRLANIITLGVVAQADYLSARVRVTIGAILSDWLPWLTLRGGNDRTWWPPEIGEQVVVLSPSGDLGQGVVLSALFQDDYPNTDIVAGKNSVTYADGAVIEYDRESHHLSAKLPSGGTAQLIADGGITIIGDVTINGNVEIAGAVTASESVSTADVRAENDVLASGVSLVQHIHSGDSGGKTGTPQ